ANAYFKHANVAVACASHALSRTHRAICRTAGGPLNVRYAAAAGARTNRMKNHSRRSLGSIRPPPGDSADDRVTPCAVKVRRWTMYRGVVAACEVDDSALAFPPRCTSCADVSRRGIWTRAAGADTVRKAVLRLCSAGGIA